MEAVPRLPMIYFELMKSEEKPNFALKLKDYIQNYYSEAGESFESQISQLDSLRASASRPIHDVTGCATLKRYYCQLHFMMSRFPMNRGGEAAVKFSWRDPYTDAIREGADVTIELSSILYNIGAHHTMLGMNDNRTSADGMKMACTHFQCAAGAFQQLLDDHSFDETRDLLQFMNCVSLAQAQECILEKSMLDNRKSNIIAKVAVQTVEYYRQALRKLDNGPICDAVCAKLIKNWQAYLKFKISYHSCIGLLYQGQQAEEEQKSGERVAYYELASTKLKEARKLSRNNQIDDIELINEALQFTQDVVEGKLKAAKSENEFVYHEQVPDASTLPEIKGASLVKGIGFNINDAEVSGPDIFARLIPIKAHETSSIYSEELADLLRNITSQVLQADESLDGFLTTLEVDNPIRANHEFPQILIDSCAALSARPDAVDNLQTALSTLSETYSDVEVILSEIRTLLEQEEQEASRYEDVVGKRPPSIVATDLTREAKKYWDAHAKAAESNYTLRNAIQMHSENLKLLSLPPRQLERHIPTITIDDAEDEAIFTQMDNLMKKIDEMKSQRNMLVGQLREAINRDDITQKIVTFTGESKSELFEKEKAKHQTLINHIRMNIAAQENIITAVQDNYPRFIMSRKKITAKLHSRNSMIQSLIAAYEAYEDLIAKSQKGIDFYKKLETSAAKLLQRVKSTCMVQQEERAHIISNISDSTKLAKNTKNMTNEANNPGSGLKLKDYLNIKKETGKVSLASTAWVPGIRPAPVGSEGNDSTSAIPFDAPYYNPPISTVPPPQLQQQVPSTMYSNQVYPGYVDPAYSHPPSYQTPIPYSTDNSSMGYYPYYNYGATVDPAAVASTASVTPSVVPMPVQATTTLENQYSYQQPVANDYSMMYGNNYYPYQPGTEYTPQQYQHTGFQQGAEYLQYGNNTLYTQTQQSMAYNPTSSQVYSTGQMDGSIQPQLNQWSTYAYEGSQNMGQNSVTYQQSLGYSTATNLTSSSSANGIMASPSVASSNVDLLAGLDFDVSQEPLTAYPVSVPEPVKEPVTATVTETIAAVQQPIPIVKQQVDEKIDVDSLKALAPDVEKLDKFVASLTQKTLSGPTMLDLKWKEITDAQEKDGHTRSISVARCYPMKNRFPDILPYDDSRIELPSTKDDYINASFVKPVIAGMPPVILTQAPMPVTFADFWTMVVEQQAEVIVCLLSDAELSNLGNHVYWPENKTQDFRAGKISISLQGCNSRQHWIERILSVTTLDTKITRVVVHLQFTAWPTSMFPTSPAPLLSFLREVKTFMQQQRNNAHPCVVHCVSGVGRSGLALVLLAATSDIESGRGIPDLVTLVTRISLARKNCLRDREYLKFAYQSVLYCAQDLLFKHGILTNRASFEENASTAAKKGHTRHPSQDYLDDLNKAQSKMENIQINDEKTENQPASLLAALDPNQFNLNPSTEKKPKMKFTPDQFSATPLSSLSSLSSNADPLSSLDPLWSLKK